MSDKPYKFTHGVLRLTDGSNRIKFFHHHGGGNITDPGKKLFGAGASTNALGSVTLTSTNQAGFSTYDTGGTNPTSGNIGRRPAFRKIEAITQSFSSQTEVTPSFTSIGFSIKNDGSNDFFVGGSSVSSSNGYKLSPGEEIPFLNCRINSINMVQSSGTCTASTISI